MADSSEPTKSELPPGETLKPSAKLEVAKLDLPAVESPSISPAEPAIEPVLESTPEADAMMASLTAPPADAPPPPAPGLMSRFALKPRQKRHALLAASVALAACIGAVAGAMTTSGIATPPPPAPAPVVVDATSATERKAMQQSIAQLSKEITTLKSSLEAANKSSHAQLAKITERVERAASAELVTGSISAPQTVPAATPAPLPTPRPAPRIAAAESTAPARTQIVQGWTVREARDGYVYVEGHGDVYQVVQGAPLPGLGPVQSVRRVDGRWVVTTPRGIIVSMRDRRFFD